MNNLIFVVFLLSSASYALGESKEDDIEGRSAFRFVESTVVNDNEPDSTQIQKRLLFLNPNINPAKLREALGHYENVVAPSILDSSSLAVTGITGTPTSPLNIGEQLIVPQNQFSTQVPQVQSLVELHAPATNLPYGSAPEPSVILITSTEIETLTAVRTLSEVVTSTSFITSYTTTTSVLTKVLSEYVTYTVIVTPPVENTYTSPANAVVPSLSLPIISQVTANPALGQSAFLPNQFSNLQAVKRLQDYLASKRQRL